MTTKPWTPEGADPAEWRKLVDDARTCVVEWLEGTDGMTMTQWQELCSGERETWGGHDADDWKYGFAVRVLDAADPDFIPPTVLAAFRSWAEEEGRIDDPDDAEAVAYACAEVAWREAVDTAEEELSQ